MKAEGGGGGGGERERERERDRKRKKTQSKTYPRVTYNSHGSTVNLLATNGWHGNERHRHNVTSFCPYGRSKYKDKMLNEKKTNLKYRQNCLIQSSAQENCGHKEGIWTGN